MDWGLELETPDYGYYDHIDRVVALVEHGVPLRIVATKLIAKLDRAKLIANWSECVGVLLVLPVPLLLCTIMGLLLLLILYCYPYKENLRANSK